MPHPLTKLLSLLMIVILLVVLVEAQETCKVYNQGICVECIERYSLYRGDCYSCGKYCLRCSYSGYISTIQCYQCEKGSFLQLNSCEACDEGCLECNNYNYSPNCLLCAEGFRMSKYQYSGRYYCTKIVVVWPYILGMIVVLVVFFAILILWALKQHRKNKRKSQYELKVTDESKFFVQTPSTVHFTIKYTPQLPPQVPLTHTIHIQVLQNIQCTTKHVVDNAQRIGNTIYHNYSTEYRHHSKSRILSAKDVIITTDDFLEGKYAGEIDFVAVVNHNLVAEHSLESRHYVKVRIMRSDWKGEVVEKEDYFRCNFQESNYRFSSQEMAIQMREGSVEVKIFRKEWENPILGKYYGVVSLKYTNTSGSPLKITSRLEKTYICNFGLMTPSKHNRDGFKNVQYIEPGPKPNMTQLQGSQKLVEPDNIEHAFSISECRILNEGTFITSTPLMLRVRVRPTGFFSALLTHFETNVYELPIMIEPCF